MSTARRSTKGYKYPNRKRTQKHSIETRQKIGEGAKKTRSSERMECPYGCGVVSNHGAISRHVKSAHEFVCAISGCPETQHKGNGFCGPHWRKQQNLYQYGMTLGGYVELYEAQDGRCAICLRELRLEVRTVDHLTKNLVGHVDHNHKCCDKGACERCRRGLLCGNCNNLLGHAKENISVLQSAIEYLIKWGELD